MTTPSPYNQPLHRALLDYNLQQLQMLADRHTMDMNNLKNTSITLSDHARIGRHITPLQAAIITGNFRTCKRLLAEGADFFSLCYDIPHPLNLALECRNFQIAKLLISSGADVCSPQNGYFPMFFAIQSSTPEYIVEMIINKGFPPNGVIETIYNGTSLHKAVTCNNVALVNLLLKYEADCNVVDGYEGFTPMHAAVKLKLPKIVKILAEHKANLEIECREGFTPIFYAVGNNDVECLDILLRYGAKINHLSSVGYIYPLNFAVSLGCVEVTEVLLRKGAEVGLCTPISGDYPIHSAVMSQKCKLSEDFAQDLETIVEMLLEKGCKVDCTNKYDKTPMQLAIMEENFKIVEFLVKEGASVNRPLEHGTSFHFVSRRGNKELVTTFLEHGADYSYLDVNKITPYHIAGMNPDLEVLRVFWRFNCPCDYPLLGENSRKPMFPPESIDLLNVQKNFLSAVKSNDVKAMRDGLAKGAEARGCSMKLSHPLHFAADNGYVQVVKLLLEKGAPANNVNDDNETPLHLAAKAGHLDVCRVLLRYGAVYNSRTKSKKTPIELAVENDCDDVVRLLQEIDSLFKSGKEKKILRKLREVSSNVPDDRYLVYINVMNRKGETLLKVSMRKQFARLTNRIMRLRISKKWQ